MGIEFLNYIIFYRLYFSPYVHNGGCPGFCGMQFDQMLATSVGIDFLSYTISWDLSATNLKPSHWSIEIWSIESSIFIMVRLRCLCRLESLSLSEQQCRKSITCYGEQFFVQLKSSSSSDKQEGGGIVIALWLSCLLSNLIRHNELLRLRISNFLGIRCVNATGVLNW